MLKEHNTLDGMDIIKKLGCAIISEAAVVLRKPSSSSNDLIDAKLFFSIKTRRLECCIAQYGLEINPILIREGLKEVM